LSPGVRGAYPPCVIALRGLTPPARLELRNLTGSHLVK
jgi:hypothetical protein